MPVNSLVADLYKTYYRLKKNVSEESGKVSKNMTNKSRLSDDVWGAHLNKSANPAIKPIEVPAKSSSFMKTLGQKLLANATRGSSQSTQVR